MEKTIKLHSKNNIENYLRMLKKADGGQSKTYAVKSEIPEYTPSNQKCIGWRVSFFGG